MTTCLVSDIVSKWQYILIHCYSLCVFRLRDTCCAITFSPLFCRTTDDIVLLHCIWYHDMVFSAICYILSLMMLFLRHIHLTLIPVTLFLLLLLTSLQYDTVIHSTMTILVVQYYDDIDIFYVDLYYKWNINDCLTLSYIVFKSMTDTSVTLLCAVLSNLMLSCSRLLPLLTVPFVLHSW